MRRAPALLLVAAMAVGLAGCGADEPAQRQLTVLAASSLTDVFGDLEREFERDHPDVDVVLTLGSSTDLAEQAVDGAPGDVLATADETSMAIAQDAGAAGDSAAVTTFATNTMVLVTAPGNPRGITGLADLDGSTWVRCADDVPCGRVAVELLDEAGVDSDPVSLEPDVRSALDKVTSGEADAGMVYASDAVSAGDAVEVVTIPGADSAATNYRIAALAAAAEPELADEWLALVESPDGRAALADAGFGTP